MREVHFKCEGLSQHFQNWKDTILKISTVVFRNAQATLKELFLATGLRYKTTHVKTQNHSYWDPATTLKRQ